MEQQPEVEILIHIGAPSRAVDDAWYRSLTASYLEFGPTRRVPLLSPVPSSSDKTNELDGQGTRQNPVQDTNTIQPSTGSFSTFRSPQASFRSVLDNAGSPRVIARCIPEEHPVNADEEATMPITQSPWQSPSSEVQDSYIGNHIDVSAFTSPTRILEHYLQRFDTPSTTPRTSQRSINTISYNTSSQASNPLISTERHEAPLVPCTPSIVPCTPRCNPLCSSGGLPRLEATAEHRGENAHNVLQHNPQTQEEEETTSDFIIEETVIESSDPPNIARADSEPAPAQRHEPNLAPDPGAVLRAASDLASRPSSDQKAILTVAFLKEHGYTYDSLELRAPDPPISMTEVESHNFITPGLERLAQDLNMQKRYRTKEVSRGLRPFERGYWLVDCSAWDSQLKRDAWAYLANYVGTGVAGWGIRCTRDSDFRWLRVYCWGLVTGHIYLLLYLASQRKILYMKSSWVDSEGIKVIVMETRE
ncbi:hypothetical protein F4804DRAFT_304725 [Jackrogersella minutella]|nr:hypothetical protein F4804DRAFT_304725 [Jackrogersella minutella]